MDKETHIINNNKEVINGLEDWTREYKVVKCVSWISFKLARS